MRGKPLKNVAIAFCLSIATNVAVGNAFDSFNSDIRPILSNKCFQCHGPNEEDREGDLRLDVPDGKQGALTPREGYHIIRPGQPDESELWYKITTDDEDDRMPPKRSHKEPLTDEEVALFRAC